MSGERDKARRRWWQISIRELLLCTLVVAAALGWWANRQKMAAEINSLTLKIEEEEKELERRKLKEQTKLAEDQLRAKLEVLELRFAEISAVQRGNAATRDKPLGSGILKVPPFFNIDRRD